MNKGIVYYPKIIYPMVLFLTLSRNIFNHLRFDWDHYHYAYSLCRVCALISSSPILVRHVFRGPVPIKLVEVSYVLKIFLQVFWYSPFKCVGCYSC